MNVTRTVLCLALAALPAIAACSASPGDDTDTGSSVDAITRSQILTRAQQWVSLGVPYCGGVRYGTDYECGGTCYRPSEPWNNYRSDCSGFVSWAWQITDDPTTDIYVTDRSGNNGWHTIPINSLVAGDAVVTKGHIKLFDKFGTGTATIYEEYDCGKVARHTSQTLTSRSASYIYFSGDSRAYHAIRRNDLTGPPSPPAPTPTSSCDVHSDGKLYCDNTKGAAMYSVANYGGSVVNHLRTSPSWFQCWTTGELHAGGNHTWYRTLGDDNGNWGYIPAVHLDTTSAFDANPTAHGLKHCP